MAALHWRTGVSARRGTAIIVGVALCAAAVTAAHAQSGGDDRRLSRIERDLKTLQSIVLQAQATGQPVEVKPEGPDPALTALQTRTDDFEATLERINGQIETLGHDLDQARRNQAAAEADQGRQMQTLNDRLGRIEAQLAALADASSAADPSLAANDAAPGPPAAPAEAGPPVRTPRRGSQAGADATARAQAQDTGVLGGPTAGPPPPPPPPQPSPAEAFAQARALLNAGNNTGAADAFQDFIARYPTNARAPEAYYWLGESFYARKAYQNATGAYASALKARPTTAWAAAAMVRLSQSLLQSNQAPQACAALAEFDQRYAARANASLKSNAELVRRRAKCG